MLTQIAGLAIAGLALTGPLLGAGDGLTAIQHRADEAIETRITSIGTALDRLGDAETLTDTHRATITTTLDQDRDGLTALRAKIDADTSASQALADSRTIFTEYRVYAVAIPQALYAAAVDRLTLAAIPNLEQASAELAKLAKGNATATADLDNANAALATATADTDGLADAILAVTPAAVDADPSVLADLRMKLTDALTSIRSAVQDGRDAMAALQ